MKGTEKKVSAILRRRLAETAERPYDGRVFALG